jgi:hypothetical protein
MKVGFTGSQRGASSAQLHTLQSLLLTNMPVDEFHHGCCVGADTQANYVAHAVGTHVVYHPPLIAEKASDLRDFPGDHLPPKPYIERNHDIVDATDMLIACPAGDEEQVRSGTWATVRYARKQGKRVIVIKRNGHTEETP